MAGGGSPDQPPTRLPDPSGVVHPLHEAAAEDARKEVEMTKRQLADAMSILTGKAGSVDDLKLEAASSAEDEHSTQPP